jgi:hypothetical protein
METNEEKLLNKVISKWDEQLEKDKAELDKQLGINPFNKEIDRAQQEIRKILQSTLYHGTGIISGELNLLEVMLNYAETYHQKKLHIKEQKEVSADLKQYMTNLLYTARDSGRDVNDAEFDTWTESQINDIDEYLTQFQTEQRQVTDEEIEKYFTSQHFDNKNGHHYRVNKDRIFGAKTMRDGKIKSKQ